MKKIILVVCLLLLAGCCSKPPVMEKAKAYEAIQSSRVKDGRMTEARRLFAAAVELEEENNKKFALFRSYGRCKEFYELSYAAALSISGDKYMATTDTVVIYSQYKYCPHCGAQLY
jgi:hypothetical protein